MKRDDEVTASSADAGRPQVQNAAQKAVLLPCPFCGGRAVAQPLGKKAYYCHCVKCGVSTCCYLDKDDAIAVWQQRSPDYSSLKAALESACESFAQLHKINRLPAGENNKGWRDARAALASAGGK